MWFYNPQTRSTGDGHNLIPRTNLEVAAERLYAGGMRNQLELVDCLKALTGLSRGEIRFNVGLMFESLERERSLN